MSRTFTSQEPPRRRGGPQTGDWKDPIHWCGSTFIEARFAWVDFGSIHVAALERILLVLLRSWGGSTVIHARPVRFPHPVWWRATRRSMMGMTDPFHAHAHRQGRPAAGQRAEEASLAIPSRTLTLTISAGLHCCHTCTQSVTTTSADGIHWSGFQARYGSGRLVVFFSLPPLTLPSKAQPWWRARPKLRRRGRPPPRPSLARPLLWAPRRASPRRLSR